jgi:S-DNA-T family DNA segregation ATPase FtsK/SpoIIIE
MIDPKVVELQQYNALPHLVVPVVTDPKKVLLALRWVVNEMEKRYQIFARVGVRNIKSFNDRPKDKPLPPQEPRTAACRQKRKSRAGRGWFRRQSGRTDCRAARGRHHHSRKTFLHRRHH